MLIYSDVGTEVSGQRFFIFKRIVIRHTNSDRLQIFILYLSHPTLCMKISKMHLFQKYTDYFISYLSKYCTASEHILRIGRFREAGCFAPPNKPLSTPPPHSCSPLM